MKKQKKEKTYLGHRRRIKDKYIANGLSGWHDYEIMELALSYSIPRKDTKPIAKMLLSKYKTLDRILSVDIKALANFDGITEHTAVFLKLLRDISIKYHESGIKNKDLLSNPDSVFDYLKTYMKGLGNEEFVVIYLNNRNYLIQYETIQKGTVNKSVVFPRQVVEKALYNKAANVIIAHNHPAESVYPSDEDKKATQAVKNALQSVDMELLDHIIIAGNEYFSFKENNLL